MATPGITFAPEGHCGRILPGAGGVVELSPFEFLDRFADLVPPADWEELVQTDDDRDVFQASPGDLPAIDIRSL